MAPPRQTKVRTAWRHMPRHCAPASRDMKAAPSLALTLIARRCRSRRVAAVAIAGPAHAPKAAARSDRRRSAHARPVACTASVWPLHARIVAFTLWLWLRGLPSVRCLLPTEVGRCADRTATTRRAVAAVASPSLAPLRACSRQQRRAPRRSCWTSMCACLWSSAREATAMPTW
eukprot:scaffold1939_cov63-Phaeocystis_antarctica.AAC.1